MLLSLAPDWLLRHMCYSLLRSHWLGAYSNPAQAICLCCFEKGSTEINNLFCCTFFTSFVYEGFLRVGRYLNLSFTLGAEQGSQILQIQNW